VAVQPATVLPWSSPALAMVVQRIGTVPTAWDESTAAARLPGAVQRPRRGGSMTVRQYIEKAMPRQEKRTSFRYSLARRLIGASNSRCFVERFVVRRPPAGYRTPSPRCTDRVSPDRPTGAVLDRPASRNNVTGTVTG
jgi:hypothetical protein